MTQIQLLQQRGVSESFHVSGQGNCAAKVHTLQAMQTSQLRAQLTTHILRLNKVWLRLVVALTHLLRAKLLEIHGI